MTPTLKFCAVAAAAAAAFPAEAQTVLDPVVITAERSRQSSFDAPASISAVTRDTIDSGGLQVNLSEVLNRVPGITVLNRQNYAQDLQLSIRGFGSRSTFGIRGVRLIVDGIPATMPDGQGQASSIALGSAQRIEVLRGPLAQLYGNAAGGVVQVFTALDATVPTSTLSAGVGAYGQTKLGYKFSAGGETQAVTLDASRFRTDGYRDHSAAQREQFNAKWQYDANPDTRVSVVVNALEQPLSLDPIGLVYADFLANPRQVAATALLQNSRKKVSQQQIGSVLEQKLGAATTLTARLYFGTRDLDNALSIPLAAQGSPTSSGGIVSFARDYAGLGLQLAHEVKLGDGRGLRLVGGLEADRMTEDRQGYINDGGNRGDLKRDELNTVRNLDLFAQAAYDIARDWTATAGVRNSRVRFRSDDRFIDLNPATFNPDDSGGVDFRATNPVAGLTWRATPVLNVYANVGRGFETPTFTELAYRSVGTGLNTDLKASRSRHAEIGAKWKPAPSHRLDAALFDIRTRDEIVVDTNQNGRSTFKNAGRTQRRGIELAWLGQYGEAWRATLSVTQLRARFIDGFSSNTNTVAAGNRLPGTPERSAFAELAWTPRSAWGGFNAALEVVHTGRLYANDANDLADAVAPAATVLNLRAGLAQTVGPWTFTQLLRVDNANDKRYAGSVIVNDGNRRYFEPAMPRNWLLALNAKYEFR